MKKRRLNDPVYAHNVQKSGYFFLMYQTILSHILAIIPHYISKYLSKKKNKEKKANTYNENRLNYIYSDERDTYNLKDLIKSTIVVSIFDFSSEAIIFIFYYINDEQEILTLYTLNTYLIFNTVAQYMVSHIVLKTKFYKHHYLSFIINVVCILIVLIIDIVYMITNEIRNYKFYIFVIIRLIRIVLFSFGDNYAKIAMYSGLITPYSLLIFKFIYETIFLSLFSIPFIFLKMNELYVHDESIFVGFKEYLTGMKLFYSLLHFFSDFLYDLILLVIIDRLSPSHLPLCYILESFAQTIYEIVYNNIKGKEVFWTLYFNFFFLYNIIHRSDDS